MSDLLSQGLSYLGSLGRGLSKLLATTSPSNAVGEGSYNWLIILFVLFVVFLVGFTMGRTRMLLALVAIYAAAFIEKQFIYFSLVQGRLPGVTDYWLHLGLFIVFYIVIFGVLNRSILKGRLVVKEASIFAISVEAVAIVGLTASIVLTYLPADQVKVLPANMLAYFTTKKAQFIWAVLPIVLALFLRSRKSVGFGE